MRASLRASLSLVLALVLALAQLVGADDYFTLTDEQYYEMPALFHLDEYAGCLKRRSGGGGLYCLGSFELKPAPYDAQAHRLYDMMQVYSSNWVDHFNHTRLHRGVCVSSRCAPPPPPPPAATLGSDGTPLAEQEAYAEWFASCVNASTMSAYNLSARLWTLDYCHTSSTDERAAIGGGGGGRALAATVAVLVALSALATVLDVTLPDHARKSGWCAVAVAWSVPGCWGALRGAPARAQAARGADLRAFDGLRVMCLMFVIIEHVAWITTQSYLADTRRFEQTRRAADAMMMANSTLVVQIFFMMSTFLLAHKLLLQQRRGHRLPAISTFCSTMINRIIRISPSYWFVVWFAATWWERLGDGPLWTPLVATEAAVCRRKWWTHLLYLNNILDADHKCLIQTWYLAADMQLYAVSVLLTLALGRVRRGALLVLAALLAASVALLAALAYVWGLVPTFVMHNPESVRSTYRDGWSFNVLYQSPLGNAPGALAGLLLAHAHHHLRERTVDLNQYKVFRWVSVASVPLAVWWVGASPRLLDGAGGPRAAAAALAALERPVFAALVALALLAAIHGVPSTVGRALAWSGWSAWARLSFGALLLHMPINKALVGARLAPTQLDRHSAVVEWFGVASVSYLAAVPLALLVELPAQRLHRALQRLAEPGPPPERAARSPAKSDL